MYKLILAIVFSFFFSHLGRAEVQTVPQSGGGLTLVYTDADATPLFNFLNKIRGGNGPVSLTNFGRLSILTSGSLQCIRVESSGVYKDHCVQSFNKAGFVRIRFTLKLII